MNRCPKCNREITEAEFAHIKASNRRWDHEVDCLGYVKPRDEHEHCDINSDMVGLIRDITNAAGYAGVPFLDDAVKSIVRDRDKARADLKRCQENIEAGIFVNATPDAEYPIRILEGHLAPNESTFVTDNLAGMAPTDPVLVEMNKASAERATILRAAIAKLRG